MVAESALRPQVGSTNPFIEGLRGETAFVPGFTITVVLQAAPGDTGAYGGAIWAASGAKDAFIQAAQAWMAVANVDIQVLPDNYQPGGNRSAYVWVEELDNLGASVLGEHSLPQAGDLGGAFNSYSYVFTRFGNTQGGYSFVTFLHEIGHGLGLTHPFDGPANLPGVTDANSTGNHHLNTLAGTVMSYSSEVGPTSPATKDYGWVATPMAFDIAAIQHIYGANMTTATGNDVYLLPSEIAVGTSWRCIWDAGGIDTISAAGLTNSATIDLRAATLTDTQEGAGYFSRIWSGVGGFTIANGVVIENAIGSRGDDFINGNDAANQLFGEDGKDIIYGQAGDDTIDGGSGGGQLYGEGGNDVLRGADGAWLYGGAGDDQLFGGSGGNPLEGGSGNDSITGGSGFDFVWAGVGDDWIDLTGGDDQARGEDGNDTIFGGLGNDTLKGEAGADSLSGDMGNDSLDGAEGGGSDTFAGGQGDDSYRVDSEDGILVEFADQGIDIVYVRTSFTLPANFEKLDLSFGGVVGVGNDANNEIVGGSASELYGLGGDDRIKVSYGERSASGGAGNDTLQAGQGGNVIHGDAGDDQFISVIYVYNPYAGASMPIGGGPTVVLPDHLFGDEGNDIFCPPGSFGTNGFDPVTGVALFGHDTVWRDELDGGAGVDSLYVARPVRLENEIRSIEQIEFFRDPQFTVPLETWTDPASVLRLDLSHAAMFEAGTRLFGTGRLHVILSGSESCDIASFGFIAESGVSFKVEGGAANNQIAGSALVDVLLGGGGDDLLTGGQGDDQIDGGANMDTAVLSGARADYAMTQTSPGLFKFVGPDGMDIMRGIEFAQFDDQTIRLRPGVGQTIDFNAADPGVFLAAMANIRDFDGHALGGNDGWLRIGAADVNGDGDIDQILVNRKIGRFAEVGLAPDGLVYFDDHGWGGETRVVGVYIDPLVQSHEVAVGGPLDSQRRFQNDLKIENINRVLGAGDYDHDGLQEVYFALTDKTAYLHAYMHADGNIRYANYQSQSQVIDYLTDHGFAASTWDGWFV